MSFFSECTVLSMQAGSAAPCVSCLRPFPGYDYISLKTCTWHWGFSMCLCVCSCVGVCYQPKSNYSSSSNNNLSRSIKARGKSERKSEDCGKLAQRFQLIYNYKYI